MPQARTPDGRRSKQDRRPFALDVRGEGAAVFQVDVRPGPASVTGCQLSSVDALTTSSGANLSIRSALSLTGA